MHWVLGVEAERYSVGRVSGDVGSVGWGVGEES